MYISLKVFLQITKTSNSCRLTASRLQSTEGGLKVRLTVNLQTAHHIQIAIKYYQRPDIAMAHLQKQEITRTKQLARLAKVVRSNSELTRSKA